MVSKEAVVQEVQKLMGNQQFIRNMGIVAHVDHGKCISGDTRLQLTDGRLVTAKEIFDRVAFQSVKVKEDENETVYDANFENLKAFSLNAATGKIEKKQIQFAWKLRGGKVLNVKLRNGLKLTTTPEHKYVVLENLKFVEKTAQELTLGDAVICPKNISVEQKHDDELKAEILKKLNSSGFYLRLSPAFFEQFSIVLKEKFGTLVNAASFCGVSKDNFSACIRKRTFTFSNFLKLCTKLSVELGIAYGGIENIFYRGGNAARSKNSKPMSLPTNFEEFFFIAGLLFGDGSYDKLVVGKPELGRKFVIALNSVGIMPFFRNYAGKTPEISAGSKTLLNVLKVLFDYPSKRKSHNIHATSFLLTSPNNYIAAFLRGYFDCDGTVEKARGAISLTSVSNQMLSDVQSMLLRFNCASIVQGDTLYISGNSVVRFNKLVGFSLPDKIKKASELAAKVVGSYVLDVVPTSRIGLCELRESTSMNSISHNYYEYENEKVNPTVGSLTKLAQKTNSGLLQQICSEELAFIEVVEKTESVEKEVYDFTVADNHNFVAQGMFVHNTTLSDTLVARAGIISKELAGEQRVLDFDEQEQARGITIKAANVSIPFKFQEKFYLINLIDTPGHVDFGGHVTRAMRAVDGVILVVDCVEGIMPQTETVLRQALKEKVKPVLFINKIDRYINELKLDSSAMQQRFLKIISGVNKLIESFAPPEFKDAWMIDVTRGNVAFGTAFNKWALSFTTMKRNNLSFKDMYQKCVDGKHKDLQQIADLGDVILEMAINHLPNPVEAQKYRIPVIWHGDLQSEQGQAMLNSDPKGKVCFMVTAIQVDPHAGEVAVGRLYSGTLRKGSDLYCASKYKNEKLQQVAIYMGPDRLMVDEVPAGNIVALVGLKDVFAGETVSEGELVPFEKIKHHSVPVVTKSVEAKDPRDLVKLVEVLKKLEKEDPTLQVRINQDTGEHLMSGMGELHLEILEYKISKERGVPITTTPPIVVYNEAIAGASPELDGKSPNKHNKFKLSVEPLEASVVEAFEKGDVDPLKKGKELVESLIKAGLPRDEAKSILAIHNNNIFVDVSKGVQYLQEIKELAVEAFRQAMDQGPQAKEKCIGVKVKLHDATIHVDPAHRGPAQILPAIRRPIYAGMLMAKAHLLEPKQKIVVNVPSEYLGGVITLINGRRGQVMEIEQEGEVSTVNGKLPVAEMFGLASDMRGATQGRAAWYYEYAGYEKLPQDLQAKIIIQIRKRKGEPETVPTAKDFLE